MFAGVPMKQLNLSRRQMLLIISVILLITVPLAIGMQNFIRESIVIPISYILWIGNYVIKAIPQEVFIGILVCIGVYIGLRTLFSVEKVVQEVKLPDTWVASSRARVNFWDLQIRLTYGSRYARSRVSQHTAKLVLDVLAHQQQIHPRQVEQALLRGDIDVPPEIKAIFDYRQMAPLPRRLWFFNFIFRGREAKAEAAQAQANIKKIVDYLEEQLELKHE
jgi:hypothetical protein